MIRAAALAAMVLVLSGCKPPTPPISKWHDPDQAVSCWAISRDRGGGISCIPDWMLAPPKQAQEQQPVVAPL